MLNKLVFLFACIHLITAQCGKFPIPDILDPKFPDLPDKFSTRIEVNKNGVIGFDLEINYDYSRRKATLLMQSSNLETKLVFDYPTNEIHSVYKSANYTHGTIQPGDPAYADSPSYCLTTPLNDTSNIVSYFFGFEYINSTYMVPFKPDRVFHLNSSNQTYNSNREKSFRIRGIPCDCYLSCVDRPESSQTFTLEFCFSSNFFFYYSYFFIKFFILDIKLIKMLSILYQV